MDREPSWVRIFEIDLENQVSKNYSINNKKVLHGGAFYGLMKALLLIMLITSSIK
jgi:hypothetical protein